MSPLSLRAIVLAALVSTSSAVSLGNFKPFLDNLSASCTTVYNSQIAGCTADDFNTGATCSDACVQGLNQIQAAVMKNCTKDNVASNSIIGVFQNNLGLAALCPSNKGGSSSSSAATATATSSATNTKPMSTTAASTTTSSASSATGTMMSGLVLDPTPRSSFSTSIVDQPTATTAQPSTSETKKPKASATRGANGQLSNQSSGGGSPFDVQATNSSPQLRITGINLAAVLATVSLLVACS